MVLVRSWKKSHLEGNSRVGISAVKDGDALVAPLGAGFALPGDFQRLCLLRLLRQYHMLMCALLQFPCKPPVELFLPSREQRRCQIDHNHCHCTQGLHRGSNTILRHWLSVRREEARIQYLILVGHQCH
jgi:hypothetical protein